MIAYTALFSRSLEQTHCAHMWCYMSDWLFKTRFLNIHLTALTWLEPHETAAVSAQVLCTPYNHAPCHFMQSHIRRVYACLAVTCHLHFWQNDRDLLRATAVTRGYEDVRLACTKGRPLGQGGGQFRSVAAFRMTFSDSLL